MLSGRRGADLNPFNPSLHTQALCAAEHLGPLRRSLRRLHTTHLQLDVPPAALEELAQAEARLEAARAAARAAAAAATRAAGTATVKVSGTATGAACGVDTGVRLGAGGPAGLRMLSDPLQPGQEQSRQERPHRPLFSGMPGSTPAADATDAAGFGRDQVTAASAGGGSGTASGAAAADEDHHHLATAASTASPLHGSGMGGGSRVRALLAALKTKLRNTRLGSNSSYSSGGGGPHGGGSCTTSGGGSPGFASGEHTLMSGGDDAAGNDAAGRTECPMAVTGPAATAGVPPTVADSRSHELATGSAETATDAAGSSLAAGTHPLSTIDEAGSGDAAASAASATAATAVVKAEAALRAQAAAVAALQRQLRLLPSLRALEVLSLTGTAVETELMTSPPDPQRVGCGYGAAGSSAAGGGGGGHRLRLCDAAPLLSCLAVVAHDPTTCRCGGRASGGPVGPLDAQDEQPGA